MGRKFQADQPVVKMTTGRVFCAYRYVRYADDGASIYACMDCRNTFEIRDDPEYWNFCPKCGRSWFGKFECREHHIPRWVYDRYGNDVPYSVRMHPETPKPRLKWVIECQTIWCRKDGWDSRETTEWRYRRDIDYRLNSFRQIKGILAYLRKDEDDSPFGPDEVHSFKNFYRARLTSTDRIVY